ncbi:MAG: lamin tail domain-containing protein [Saprospiraceae bacterium]|nr:lamin tail domain-containing protein [Saprospiraceae bacterium]
MKKTYLTLAFIACIGLLTAQQVNSVQQVNSKKEVSEFSQAELQKKAKAEKLRFHNRTTNTKAIKSRWYNAAFEIDNLLGGIADISANNLFPDTNILVDYGSSGYSGPWIHSIGECIDPVSSWYTPLPSSTILSIDKSMPYTVDSVGVYCIYSRNTASSIVDTLLIQIRQSTFGYRYWAYSSAPWIYTNFQTDTLAFRPVPHDLGKIYSTDAGVITIKYPLNVAAANDTTPGGFNYFKVAPPSPLSITAGEQVIVTVGFIPGYSWTANVDTLSSKNRLRFISNEENGAGTYCYYDKWDWTCSFIESQYDLYETNTSNLFYTSSFAYSWSVPTYAYEHHWGEVLLSANDTNTYIDSIPPIVTNVYALSPTSIKVEFSEAVDISAENTANYTGLGAIISAVRNVNYDYVTLTLSTPLVNGASNTLTVNNIMDANNNIMPAAQYFTFIFNNSQADIVITEIMYNDQTTADLLEYFEIYNKGTTNANIGGYVITEGVDFTFPANTVLAPGNFLVVAKDDALVNIAFSISGTMKWNSGELDNNGEDVQIKNTIGTVIDVVDYDNSNPWPIKPNGGGASLVLCDASVDNNNPANWIAAYDFVTVYNGDSIFGNPKAHCGPISVNEINESKYVEIYPNPAKDEFVINTSGEEYQISIVSIDGREISRENIHTNQSKINVKGLNSGIYFIHFSNSETGNSFVKKLIVE